MEELDEQREQSQSLLKQLQIQKNNVATLNCELQPREDATKLVKVLSL